MGPFPKLLFFPQHLVEGLLNFRRRVCRSFWLDLAFQDPPPENGPIEFPQRFLHREEEFFDRMRDPLFWPQIKTWN